MTNSNNLRRRNADWDEQYPDGRDEREDRTSPDVGPVMGSVWRSRGATGATEQVTLPSGEKVLARKLDIETVASSGLLAEQDSISQYVDDTLIDRGRSGRVRAAQKAEQQKNIDLPALVMAMDRIVPLCVVEPRVLLHFEDVKINDDRGMRATRRIPESERKTVDPSGMAAWTDQIPFNDKVGLTAWAMSELSANFREATGAAVADLGHGKGVPGKAKRTRKDRSR